MLLCCSTQQGKSLRYLLLFSSSPFPATVLSPSSLSPHPLAPDTLNLPWVSKRCHGNLLHHTSLFSCRPPSGSDQEEGAAAAQAGKKSALCTLHLRLCWYLQRCHNSYSTVAEEEKKISDATQCMHLAVLKRSLNSEKLSVRLRTRPGIFLLRGYFHFLCLGWWDVLHPKSISFILGNPLD